MNIQQRYSEATVKTADSLKSVAHSKKIQELSTLSLPEIEAVVDLVARVIPAGNVPGMILNGLARLPGRRPCGYRAPEPRRGRGNQSKSHHARRKFRFRAGREFGGRVAGTGRLPVPLK